MREGNVNDWYIELYEGFHVCMYYIHVYIHTSVCMYVYIHIHITYINT
jgi:hypothetical protein